MAVIQDLELAFSLPLNVLSFIDDQPVANRYKKRNW